MKANFMELSAEEARKFVDRISPCLGHDFTYTPLYPKGRKDVCAVRHSSEDGEGYGFDTIFLLWRDKSNRLRFMKLSNSNDSKDYVHIDEIGECLEDIIVKINSGNGCEHFAWSTIFREKKLDLDLA